MWLGRCTVVPLLASVRGLMSAMNFPRRLPADGTRPATRGIKGIETETRGGTCAATAADSGGEDTRPPACDAAATPPIPLAFGLCDFASRPDTAALDACAVRPAEAGLEEVGWETDPKPRVAPALAAAPEERCRSDSAAGDGLRPPAAHPAALAPAPDDDPAAELSDREDRLLSLSDGPSGIPRESTPVLGPPTTLDVATFAASLVSRPVSPMSSAAPALP
mmetsp:Transcript_26284/g.65847  ORF Transcript_26284/g.65847 Transcript_26284/m.65847 type:complete len:221 (-) Transcript_26284:41-703(-)